MSIKILSGIVIKDITDKTITVLVKKRIKNNKYSKIVKRNKKYIVHDENNFFALKDRVKIISSRPISKLKSWNVLI